MSLARNGMTHEMAEMLTAGRSFRLLICGFVGAVLYAALAPVAGAFDFDFKISTYQDPETKVTFYIESDRHHVAAISSDGRLLWVRDPFRDANVPFYRGPQHSPIWAVGAAKTGYEKQFEKKGAKFIEVKFVSSQFGLMDQRSGQFIVLGQN